MIDFAEHVDLDRLNAFDDLGHMAHVNAFWNSESTQTKELLKKNLELTYKVDALKEQNEKEKSYYEKEKSEFQRNLQHVISLNNSLQQRMEQQFKQIDKLNQIKRIYLAQQKHLASKIAEAYQSIELNGEGDAKNAMLIRVIEELQKLDVAGTEQDESDDKEAEEPKDNSKSEQPKIKPKKKVKVTIQDESDDREPEEPKGNSQSEKPKPKKNQRRKKRTPGRTPGG